MQSLEMSHVVTAANYDEAAYLAANPDVAEALMAGNVSNGRQHFDLYGIHEGRRARATAHLPPSGRRNWTGSCPSCGSICRTSGETTNSIS
jgi:hypothetical protein